MVHIVHDAVDGSVLLCNKEARALHCFEPQLWQSPGGVWRFTSMGTVKIGNRQVGAGQPCFIVAEIGINHNGDVDLAKRLISVAVAAGCDAVKFQKRTIDVVYTAEELATPRENPFGATNGDLKRGLEFGPRTTPRSTPSANRSRFPGSRRPGTRARSTSSSSSTRRCTRSPPPR